MVEGTCMWRTCEIHVIQFVWNWVSLAFLLINVFLNTSTLLDSGRSSPSLIFLVIILMFWSDLIVGLSLVYMLLTFSCCWCSCSCSTWACRLWINFARCPKYNDILFMFSLLGRTTADLRSLLIIILWASSMATLCHGLPVILAAKNPPCSFVSISLGMINKSDRWSAREGVNGWLYRVRGHARERVTGCLCRARGHARERLAACAEAEWGVVLEREWLVVCFSCFLCLYNKFVIVVSKSPPFRWRRVPVDLCLGVWYNRQAVFLASVWGN